MIKKGRIICYCPLATLIAIGVLINYYNNSVDSAVKTVSQPMQVAFQSSKAIFVESKLQGWAKINDHFSSRRNFWVTGHRWRKPWAFKE